MYGNISRDLAATLALLACVAFVLWGWHYYVRPRW